MRKFVLLATASMLSACGGSTAPQTVGSVAAPAGPTPTPTPAASFVAPTEAKTYDGLGVVQHYEYHTDANKSGQAGQLYAGDATTARDGGITVMYDPRDAIFDITINRAKGLVTVPASRFQDPVHRTDFGGLRQPQVGVPQLAAAKGIQYLQSGSSSGSLLDPASPGYPTGSDYAVGANGYTSTTQTFFYQKPGTTTKYVTYAGFVRNTLSTSTQTDVATNVSFLRNSYSLDRAAFVYGERTTNGNVPKTGSGTYTGDMIATIVFNPRPDTDPSAATYFQWIDGSQTTTVNFATLAVNSTFTGTVLAPTRDAYTNGIFDLPGGSTFSATSHAVIDLINKGGFTGSFDTAKFTRPGLSDFVINIAGSSIDGAFFGPNGEEIGGGYRIVGGTPDQRIDILGTFTGKK